MFELGVFVILWILTFPIAWKLLPRLLLLQPKDYKRGIVTWLLWRVFYLAVILLPYVVYLSTTTTNDIIKSVVIVLGSLSISSAILKLLLAKKIVKYLWYVYGFVYDGLLSFYPYRDLQSKVAERVYKNIPDGAKVLDLGCGTGNLIQKLSNLGQLHITGVDSSESMLKAARRKLIDKKNVRIENADLLAYLTVQDNDTFDAITLVNVLYTQQNQLLFLAELNRVLKSGGLLVVSDPDRSGNWALIADHLKHDSLIKLFNPKLVLVWVIDNFISTLSKNSTFIFNSENDIKRLFVKAEFQSIDHIERVYGGDKNGVNLLMSYRVA